MADAPEAPKTVEERLGSVEHHVTTLRTEVGELRGEVGGLRGEVGVLRGEVHKLRVLGERNALGIKVIAEVQSHHGKTLELHSEKLDRIELALAPLKDIHDFVRRVAQDHELRIIEVEKRTGVRE